MAMCAATLMALGSDDCITLGERDVRDTARDDPVYQRLLAEVREGDWHAYKMQKAPCMCLSFTVQDRLAVVGNLVTYTFDQGCVPLVIPEFLNHQVATHLHIQHQGLDSMLRWAR